MNGIKKDTWLRVSDPKDRDALLFDMLEGIDKSIQNKFQVGEDRFEAVEKSHTDLAKRFDRRKKWDTAAAAGGGVVGGATTMAGMLFARVLGWIK